MSSRKHIPQRTCVACRQKSDKRLLTRLVRRSAVGVVVDPSGKLNGRGAYLCQDPACWDKALNGQLLEQALRIRITSLEKQALLENKPAATP